MSQLLELLATELERPRSVTAQVMRHIIEAHGVAREDIGPFLVNELPGLEDYEADLVLSPLFTPTLSDQAAVAGRLGGESVPTSEWPALVRALSARPTRAQLITDDGLRHAVPLPEVIIERYLHRLRLDGRIPDSLLSWLRDHVAPDVLPVLLAVARRAVWESDDRRKLLEQFLRAAAIDSDNLARDAAELLKLVETYRPAGVAELLGLIPHWQDVLRAELNAGTPTRPFFNERVEELHGGGRDQRRPDDVRVAGKRAEADFLQRLQRWLSTP
jgi:hypothetical protein